MGREEKEAGRSTIKEGHYHGDLSVKYLGILVQNDTVSQSKDNSLILPLLHQTFLFSCPAKITDKDEKDHLYRKYKVEFQCAISCILHMCTRCWFNVEVVCPTQAGGT